MVSRTVAIATIAAIAVAIATYFLYRRSRSKGASHREPFTLTKQHDLLCPGPSGAVAPDGSGGSSKTVPPGYHPTPFGPIRLTNQSSQAVVGPIPIHNQDYLLPASLSLVIQGYVYQEPPKIRRDGVWVTPLQSSHNHNDLVYTFIVSAPNGPKGHEWELETTDFVEPVVTNGRTGAAIGVELLRRRYLFNRWKLSP